MYMSDLEIGEWHSQSDGTRLRDLSYTLALNYSFGPKFSHTTDHQIYSKMGQPGLKHIVDTEVCTYLLCMEPFDHTNIGLVIRSWRVDKGFMLSFMLSFILEDKLGQNV